MSSKNNTIEEQIMNAACIVFIQKGYENTKMQNIADQAGIKRTALNYYFRSKEALYNQTSKRIIQRSFPHLLKILNTDNTFEKKISEFVETYIKLALKNPFIQLFIINEINRIGTSFMEKIVDDYKPEINNFLKQIEHEIEKGNLINVNPIQIHLHLISLCVFPIVSKPLTMLVFNMDEKEFQSIIEERKKEVVRLFFKGVKA